MLESSQMRPLRIVSSVAALALLLLVSPRLIRGQEEAVDDGSELLRLRGRAFCLDPATNLESHSAECDQPGARFAFRALDDRLFFFLEEDPRSEMFIDPRVRSQALQIEGWERPEGQFELLAVHSIKNGVLHHIHYRCEICDITATAPGPCWCCGQDFELREEPLTDEPSG